MIDGAWTMWGKKGEPGRVQTVTAALDLPQWGPESGPPLRVAVAGDFCWGTMPTATPGKAA